MVELRLCSSRAARIVVATRFPFAIGRKDADWIITEPGVWDRHLVIEQAKDRRFVAVPQAEAQVCLGGRAINVPSPLQNGDMLDLGSVQLQFRIAPTRQRSLASLETSVWIGLGVLAAAQFGFALAW
ncbi:MAG TPA: FHA domain-containing protein [Verrucomicrobiota bacterium]|nr:hypothetical protein [Verrucomicrobiales bacterium]HRI15627.1 FHA domain-containing protein [Verrucomicrobiota bacterium]